MTVLNGVEGCIGENTREQGGYSVQSTLCWLTSQVNVLEI